MAQPIISLNNIAIDLGDKKLFSQLNFTFNQGEKCVLLGRNGSGKSTLLKIIAGMVEPDDGLIARNKELVLNYLSQNPQIENKNQTILDYCTDQGTEPWRCQALLDTLNLDEEAKISTLSGGELRKIAIVRALAADSDVLLLDEPTNHLDITTIEWLESQLKQFKGSLILISHDRLFAENISRSCLWLENGRLHKVPVPLSAFDDWQNNFFEQEALKQAQLDKYIAKETRWSHQGISARRKRNQGRLRRLNQLRTERMQQAAPSKTANLNIIAASQSGKEVVDAQNISYYWNEDDAVIRNLDLKIQRKDRIGIIGANGVGKTTLLRLLIGDLEPTEGSIKRGTKLQPLWIDQNRQTLSLDKTIWETLAPSSDHVVINGQSRHVASYAEDFLFNAAQLRSPVRSLSGGEQNRLSLALAFTRPGNFIILDEPTNDLDMETLELLQEVLSDFEGTLLIISHDRHFLDCLVDKCLFFEGNGKIMPYAGGWTDAIAQGAKLSDPSLKKSPSTASELQLKEKSNIDQKTSSKPNIQKLSYKHKYALDNLPKEIDALSKKIIKIEKELSDQDLFSSNPDLFQKLSAQLTDHQTKREHKEEELLEAEILLEELKDQ